MIAKNISSRHVMTSGLVVFCIVFSLMANIPAKADVGVQPVLPGGSNIEPKVDTPIQMKSEVVTINVRSATEADNSVLSLNADSYGFSSRPVWYVGIAEVEADFSMWNPTKDVLTMTVWFPLASALEKADWNLNPGETVPRIQNFAVSVNGNLLNYAVAEMPNPQGTDRPRLPWASFVVTFAAGAETQILITYTLPLQPSIKGKEMALYYVFQTGASWAESIGKAELIVNLPYPASKGTIAAIEPGKFSLPYMSISRKAAILPAGVVLDGNQARWTWENFEPTPADDFAVWLLQPAVWNDLEDKLADVKSNSQDGQAWLDLGILYYSASYTGFLNPLIFHESYSQPGLEAFQKAALLIPEHPSPHAGIALLTLAPYMVSKDAPLEKIELVMREYETATDLYAKNPDLANQDSNTGWMLNALEEALSLYNFNAATATVVAATQAVYNSTYTAEATIQHATRTAAAISKATFISCYATSGADCYLTPSPHVESTLTPSAISPVDSPTTSQKQGNSADVVMVILGLAIVLFIAIYLVVKGNRKKQK